MDFDLLFLYIYKPLYWSCFSNPLCRQIIRAVFHDPKSSRQIPGHQSYHKFNMYFASSIS